MDFAQKTTEQIEKEIDIPLCEHGENNCLHIATISINGFYFCDDHITKERELKMIHRQFQNREKCYL